MHRTTHLTVLLALPALLLTACGGDSEPLSSEPTDPTRDFEVEVPDVDTDWPFDTDVPVPMDPVPFAGTWVDGWDTSHEISDEAWQMGESGFSFVEVDAESMHIIAENDADNEYNPGKFSRFDWTVVDEVTWFCQTTYDADDADAARAVARADDSDPATGGCGTFAWSRLYEPLPIRGDWVDNWGGSHTVKEWQWTSGESSFAVTAYDTEAGWIVAQNAPDNEYNPDLWSRFEWTQADGQLYFCQVAYNAETEADALAAGPADDSDPANGGCSSFAWSELSAPE